MKLTPGIVDREGEHIELLYGNAERLDSSDFAAVALVAPSGDDYFVVQHVSTAEGTDSAMEGMIEEVQSELRFFLVEKHEPDPWAYALYHCTTVANWYSRVHWTYCIKGEQRWD